MTELAGRALGRRGAALTTGRPARRRGRQVGATGALDPLLHGERLLFTRDGDHFFDAGTGYRWNVLGEAVDGPLAGTRLEPVEHLDTFWFARAAFHPTTCIADPG